MDITPLNIASSVAQGALQQSQTARARDSAGNAAAYRAMQLRKEQELNNESVEDSYETSDDHLTVRDEDDSQQQDQPEHEDGSDDEAKQHPHIDLQA